jgi:Kef-type K+ transport system membrane component KefB
MAGLPKKLVKAFVAGLWFGQTSLKKEIDAGITAIAYGIFVPVFFINIGLSVNARELSIESGFLMLAMLVIAIIGKIIGAGWGAMLGGLTKKESLQLGVGMISRGEVGLIVASFGISQGFLQPSTLSVFVVVVVITTILTPMLLRWMIVSGSKGSKTDSISQEGVGK